MPEDDVVIVTGAASGLGKAMALGLLAAGRRVAAVDLESAQPSLAVVATAAARAGGAERFAALSGSVRSSDDAVRIVDETRSRFGRVDALVNNAGLGAAWISPAPPKALTPFYDIDVDKWRALIDTNVNGPFLMAHAVAPHLMRAGWGRIINVTTSYPTMVRGGNSPYGPAKAALEAATLVWSRDLGSTGVTVNVLIPGGASDTPMVPAEAVPDRQSLIAPSVMIPPVVWLTSRASDGVTGRRFIARNWDPRKSNADNIQSAGSPAAWNTQGD